MSSTMLKVHLVLLVCVGGFRVVMSSGGAHAAFDFNQALSASVDRVLLVQEATFDSNVGRQLLYTASTTAGSVHVLPAAPSPSTGCSSQIIQAGYSAVVAQASARSSTPHISPSVLVVVVILSVVFILSGFLHLLARCLGRSGVVPAQGNRELPPSPLSGLHGQLQHLFHLHDAGVEQAFIDALPVFSYGSIRGLKDSADCAVCLNEFGEEDRLRLLPKCKHAFHLDCIDTWLLSNSTCPLCRRSLLPDTMGSTAEVDQAGTSSSITSIGGSLCTQAGASSIAADHQPANLRASSFRPGSSLRRGSNLCESSLRIREEDEDDQCEIQVEETPSPAVPTVRVTDSNGMSKILTVELGKVKMDSKRIATTRAGRRPPSKRTSSPRRIQKGGRSYSMGSYEYVVDPSNLELMIAPTPFPGRPQNWAPSRPTHRSALSDSIPELASAGGTPAKDDLFWASRGLYTPRTLSRVRELLSPSPGSSNFSPAFLDSGFSPLGAGVSYVRDHQRHWTDININMECKIEADRGEDEDEDEEEEEVRSEASSQETQTTGNSDRYLEPPSRRSVYLEAPSGRNIYFETPSGRFYLEADEGSRSGYWSESQQNRELQECQLPDHESIHQSALVTVAAGTTTSATDDDSQPQTPGQSFRARFQAALRAKLQRSESDKNIAMPLAKLATIRCEALDTNNNLARRSSSLSRLPETAKTRLNLCRRSLSETSGLDISDDQHLQVWDVPTTTTEAAAAAHERKPNSSSSTDQSIMAAAGGSKSKRYTLHWLVGRDRRVVYSAATPPPPPPPPQLDTSCKEAPGAPC